ncbi:MAG: GNAT family N-acetyltransferase [Acetatifactor sp.]|nr:GNAT family N-acetyltransferase [Acetatifactor sp.]
MSIEIRRLSIVDGRDVYEMLQKIPPNENGFVNSANGKNFEEFQQWLHSADDNSKQESIIDGWKVPQTTYWCLEDEKPVGYGKVRHLMTDCLLIEGGNIGYAIIPEARNKGLGKRFLALLLDESKKLGVDKALLTIKQVNKASVKVALANDGVVDKIENGLYYIWIDLR